jgi:hypothetical protein
MLVAIQPLTTVEQGYVVIFLLGPLKPLLNDTTGAVCYGVVTMLVAYYLVRKC